MGYPARILGADEELLLHRHPAASTLVGPVLTLLAGTALAGYGLGAAQRYLDDPARPVALLGIALVWALLVLWRVVGPVLRWRTTHLVVTDQRVLVRRGVVRHAGVDIPLSRIANIAFRHGLAERLLRTGTLVVVFGGEAPLELPHVPAVERVHSLIYQEILEAREEILAADASWEQGQGVENGRIP